LKKIIIIVDALKDANLQTISLNQIFDDYSKFTILPPFSFEPDAAYLTGYPPEKTDSGTMYWYHPGNSIFHNIPIIKFLPENPLFLKKICKRIIIRHVKERSKFPLQNLNIGLIPFNELKNYSLSHENNWFDGKINNKYQTIFNLLRKKGIEYTYLGVPFSNGSLDNIKKIINDKYLHQNNIIFIYLSDLDSIGHKKGIHSGEYNNKINDIHKYIQSLKEYYDKSSVPSKFLVFGDHGMVEVERTINIQKILKGLPVKREIDYTYFLDSTLARFWFKNKKTYSIIFNRLKNNKYGSWITQNDKDNYQINYNHNKFGDLIWWASGGTLISPNYWQGTKVLKGMHGYRNEVSDNNTMILGDLGIKFPSETISMMDVHKILLDFLDIGNHG
jgi:predicted AlkP superfamily pyrophosphatase or phosphodiesterase